MTITKYGHSCLLIETNGTRILTDVGSWNETPDATGVNAIVITHEHGDHFDLDKIKAVLANNPDAAVVTHAAVAKLLEEEGIQTVMIEPGQRIEINGVGIESYGTEHAIIYGSASPCRNTGFLIADMLFIPGDALHDLPPKPVSVLALPTGGPWMKIAEAIDYAKAVNPKVVFPIHDALYTEEVRNGMVPRMIGAHLEPAGIGFEHLADGETREF
jgi:L-ascorbate metabolism protein UlaG (beta-lactamase superfamily)